MSTNCIRCLNAVRTRNDLLCDECRRAESEPDPFVLLCNKCDAGDGIDSQEQAILKGWIELVEDDGLSWTWLGRCPKCMTKDEMREAKREQREHDRYEEQADEAHAIAREQEIDDDELANERQ